MTMPKVTSERGLYAGPTEQEKDQTIAALLAALRSLEQAYTNKHSPQHRQACLIEARSVLAAAEAQS